MKDALGHGSNPGAHQAGVANATAGKNLMRTGQYVTKTLGNGKVAVYRKSTGTMMTKFANQASADHHIARQEAEDHTFRTARVTSYLDERKARPAQVRRRSDQLSMF